MSGNLDPLKPRQGPGHFLTTNETVMSVPH